MCKKWNILVVIILIVSNQANINVDESDVTP